jgi:hypothetical protein
MIATPEDAHLLFNKWVENAPPLQIKLMSSSLIFNAVGVVTDFSPATLKLEGQSWVVAVPLSDASFTFSDPREVEIASIRASQAAKYELGLSVRLANGDELVLLELKAPEPADELDA